MQRRKVLLPGAGRAEHRDHLAAVDGQVDALEHLVVAELLADADAPRPCARPSSGLPAVGLDLAARGRRRVRSLRPSRRSSRLCTRVRIVVSTRYQMLATMSSGICWKLRP